VQFTNFYALLPSFLRSFTENVGWSTIFSVKCENAKFQRGQNQGFYREKSDRCAVLCKLRKRELATARAKISERAKPGILQRKVR
jgi:hypothetical protein